jgi:hypothetical protein
VRRNKLLRNHSSEQFMQGVSSSCDCSDTSIDLDNIQELLRLR